MRGAAAGGRDVPGLWGVMMVDGLVKGWVVLPCMNGVKVSFEMRGRHPLHIPQDCHMELTPEQVAALIAELTRALDLRASVIHGQPAGGSDAQ